MARSKWTNQQLTLQARQAQAGLRYYVTSVFAKNHGQIMNVLLDKSSIWWMKKSFAEGQEEDD